MTPDSFHAFTQMLADQESAAIEFIIRNALFQGVPMHLLSIATHQGKPGLTEVRYWVMGEPSIGDDVADSMVVGSFRCWADGTRIRAEMRCI